MEICPVGAMLIYMDRRTDYTYGQDERNRLKRLKHDKSYEKNASTSRRLRILG
jgi:hypothetical protein